MLPSGSIRVTRPARVSVNSTLPSGIPTGPSAPSNPVLINAIGVPAATTPGMAVSTMRSVGTGSVGAAPPAPGAAAGSAGVAAVSVSAGPVSGDGAQAARNRLAARSGIQRRAFDKRMGLPFSRRYGLRIVRAGGPYRTGVVAVKENAQRPSHD